MTGNQQPERSHQRNLSFNPPQVKEREHGATVQLPVVRVGTGHAEPGDVAALIMGLPFKKARIRVDSEAFKHPSIEAMHGLPYKREPFLRPTNAWAVSLLLQNIEEKLCRVESAMIQIVGEEASDPCRYCREASGPWAKCVSVKDVDGVTSCGNCYWSDRKEKCEFYCPTAAQTERAEAHKRRNTDFSQLHSELAASLEEHWEDLRVHSNAISQDGTGDKAILHDIRQDLLDDDLDDHDFRANVRRLMRRQQLGNTLLGQCDVMKERVRNMQNRLNQVMK